jgi:glycosyltransferase involved in cell wall biosynthesis
VQVVVVSSGARSARRSLLLDGLARHHPDARVVVVRTEPRVTEPAGPGQVLARRLRPGGWRWSDLVLALGERDAARAALPWLVELAVGEGPALVLDDTMAVLAPLPESLTSDRDDGLVVGRAAHVDPGSGLPWGGLLDGAVRFPGSGAAVAGWWRRRLGEVLTAPGAVPRPWVSPPSAIALCDPSLRVTPATLVGLELVVGGRGVATGDGRLVALVDLDGFDPTEPWWYAPREGAPARHPSQDPALRRLCLEVADGLLAHGWEPAQEPAEVEPVPGIRADAELRAWYRALLGERPPGQVPNPYEPGEVAAFLELLAGRPAPGAAGPTAHLDLLLAARPDLRAAFPRSRWADRRSLLRWAWSHGLAEGATSMATLPPPAAPPATVQVTEGPRPFGVNLTGYLDADLGLGVAARRMATALRAVGVPVAEVTYDRTSSNLRGERGGDDRPYHFNLLLITPDQLPFYVADVGADALSGHHNVGLWYGETDVLTPRELASFDLVDEVWASTSYLRDVYAAPGRVPVSLVPVPLVFDRPRGGPAVRERLGLDDRFTFLFSFDFLSVVERKNPAGLVRAYSEAFGPDEGTRLVLKSINGHLFPRERERLADLVADRPDVDLRDQLLSAADRLALVGEADCYVSLHRSEGLGLTMAEAMAVGTPVVATAYSGNLDFMDDDCAVLVPAAEVLIGPGSYYPAEGHWAEPDHAAAVAALRRVRTDEGLRRRLADAGPRALERFSSDAVGATALRRLLEVWGAVRATC